MVSPICQERFKVFTAVRTALLLLPTEVAGQSDRTRAGGVLFQSTILTGLYLLLVRDC
jgi:hypothetical protein